jgi:ribosomal subunit interface protein
MIKKLEISGQHTKVTPELKKYVTRKIGRLDRYQSRHTRESMHAEVHLKESKAKDKKQFTCSVVLHLPHETLDASETTINMFAAIDIVETKLKSQLKKYKDTHTNAKFHRRIVARLRRGGSKSGQVVS